MEFLKLNYVDTTTAIAVDSNTLSSEFLLNRDPTFQYLSVGFNNDNTTTSITISFNETLTVSRIGLQEFNAKSFDIYYNGSTANSFSFSTTSATITSQWSNNSESSMFLKATPVSCNSITLDLKTTQIADSEKAIGYIYIGDTKLVFPRIPTSKNWKPKKTPREIVHKLSDGGRRIHIIDKKFDTKIKFKYITQDFKDDLEVVWNEKSDFFFVAFGTSTSWDNIFYQVVWPGVFDFNEYSEDSKTANFTGSITLNEVSG